jgi:DNA uptake protein ComE-like DNA-binding protein
MAPRSDRSGAKHLERQVAQNHRAHLCLAIFSPAISTVAKKKAPDHPLALNVANRKQLQELPGAGTTRAQAIFDFREKSGRFQRLEVLWALRRIPATKRQKRQSYPTVGMLKPTMTPTPAANKPAAGKPASPPAKRQYP